MARRFILAAVIGGGMAAVWTVSTATAQSAPAARDAMVDRESAPPPAPGSGEAPVGAREQGPAPGEAPPPSEAGPAAAGQEQPAGVPPGHRDPFWPVGYVPRPVVKPVAGTPEARLPASVARPPVAERPPNWTEATRRVDIRGTSRIGREKSTGAELYQAVVNGRVVEPGDTISVSFEGRTYRWRVQAITSGGVSLTRLDARSE